MSDSNQAPNGVLEMWVVYDKPKDYPEHIMARKWNISAGKVVPTETVICHTQYINLEITLEQKGLHKLPPDPHDDPKIKEVWV